MNEHFEAQRQLFLKWVRSGQATTPDEMMLVLGLSVFGDALTQEREDEFADAIRDATANRAEATQLVFDYACRMGSLKLVHLLMPTDGVDCTDLSRAKPLTGAVQAGYVEIVLYLLAESVTRLSGHVHLSMMKEAVCQGNVEIIEFLLMLADEDFDVDVHVRFDDSTHEQVWTCGSLLERAIRQNNVNAASALLSHGASGLAHTPEIVKWVSSVEMAELPYSNDANFSGEGGLQAAIWSIRSGNNDLFHFLLDHGADIRRAQYTSTDPPFHAALLWGGGRSLSDCKDVTACLVDCIVDLFSCEIDVDARSEEDGLTALQDIASRKSMFGQERLVKVFVDLGASTQGCKGLDLSALLKVSQFGTSTMRDFAV